MSCRQVESLREDTDAIPFTYNLNGHYIEFGREEFCLITGLRFGLEYSEHYVEVIVLFIFKGARPNRRLRPDAFEAKAGWWVCSRDFFDGRIHEAPPILSLVNLPSRYDVPKYVDRRFDEHQRFIKELQQKNDAQEKMLKEVYNFYKGQSKPVEVREHYGLTDFSGVENSQASSSFFDVGQTTPIYTATFEQPMPSRYPTSYPGTPHIATLMAQQRFSTWSSKNEAGPSQKCDVGGVNPDAMHRGNREIRPRKYQQSPFTCLPETTVEELMYMGSRASDDYISLHNVDPNKVAQNKYVECMRFLDSPESVFLDCFIKGFIVEVQFWGELVPYLCKGAISTESNPDHIGWLSNYQINCSMELMIRARPPGARYTVAKTGTSSMLETSYKFVIEIDFHLMGMLDGSSCPYPSWDEVDIVYMPINSEGNQWVTGILNLRWSTIHIITLDSVA
nr:phospholipase-like protein [Tanacetum cinerariifolium]